MARLSDYKSKRDFSRTAEPRGRVAKTKTQRFVIQRHDATRLHFDFRLELDGVYKSWAVTKVPSLDPATKRLAVEVEDHPLDYGTFEGTIPQGEYGGGTVQLWDRGTWQSQSASPPLRDLEKGQLKIVLKGKRLKGGWALVRLADRTRKTGKRHNWLLIKEKDGEARPGEPDTLLDDITSVKSGRTLAEIAAQSRSVWHSDKAAKTSSVKKKAQRVGSVAQPDFIEPELCRSVSRPPDGAGWVHEVKFDGYRIQARIEKSDVRLLSRNGLDWTQRFSEIALACAGLPDCCLDGEIVALNGNGVSDFSLLQAALSDEATAGLVYFVFDLLFLEGADLRNEVLERRKNALAKILAQRAGKQTRLRFVSHLAAPGAAILDAACRLDLEGVISKRLTAVYHSGRSGNWLKAKCRGGQEVVVGGWWGDARHIRSLLVGARREDGFAYLGRVGTGFNARNVGDLLQRLKPLTRATSPFLPHSELARASGVTWVEPQLVVETEFANVTAGGLLRQASFKGVREDKVAKQVHAEPVPQMGRVAMTKARPAKTKTASGIAISHPEKILWPANGKHRAVSKADLAAYYQMAAPRLLPFIAGRPVSLVRAPDGIEGQHFFQRHVMEGMAGAASIAVKGEAKAYLAINDVAGLIGAAQAGGLELHPWGCKKGDPDIPEILIFDLDPAPDVGFDRVIAAAKALAVVLRGCGLKTFVKTTGGKGLHVVVPVRSTPAKPARWADAKAFARDVCVALETDAPERYTTNMAKAKRGGKIFLDYLRNDRTSTAVAPWSPRARAHAPLAVPLSWAQVKTGLDPQAFTLPEAAKLLRRADPWKDFFQSAVLLSAARKAFDAR